MYVALSLGWITLIALNLDGTRTPLAGYGQGVDAYPYWLTETKILLWYMKLAVWPWPLVIHYEFPYLESIREAWPYVLTVALLAMATVWLVLRRTSLGFVMTWIVAILSPTLVVPMVTEAMVERRMYLPLAAMMPMVVGVCYLLVRRMVEGAWRDSRGTMPSRASAAVCVVAVTALSAAYILVTERRIEDYRDELSIWRAAEAIEPADFIVQVNLGFALGKLGRHDEALAHFIEGVRLAPDSSHAHYNLARALYQAGRTSEAIDHYLETLRIKPRSAGPQQRRHAAGQPWQDPAGHRALRRSDSHQERFCCRAQQLGHLAGRQRARAGSDRTPATGPGNQARFRNLFQPGDRLFAGRSPGRRHRQRGKGPANGPAQNQTAIAEQIDEWLTAYRNSATAAIAIACPVFQRAR